MWYSTSNTLRLLSSLTSSSPMTFSSIPCQPPTPHTLEIIITLYHSQIPNSNMTLSDHNLQNCCFNHYHHFFQLIKISNPLILPPVFCPSSLEFSLLPSLPSLGSIVYHCSNTITNPTNFLPQYDVVVDEDDDISVLI